MYIYVIMYAYLDTHTILCICALCGVQWFILIVDFTVTVTVTVTLTVTVTVTVTVTGIGIGTGIDIGMGISIVTAFHLSPICAVIYTHRHRY